jgi:hypothetical protein
MTAVGLPATRAVTRRIPGSLASVATAVEQPTVTDLPEDGGDASGLPEGRGATAVPTLPAHHHPELTEVQPWRPGPAWRRPSMADGEAIGVTINRDPSHPAPRSRGGDGAARAGYQAPAPTD